MSPAVPITPPVSMRSPLASARVEAERAPAIATLLAVSVIRSVSVEIPICPPTSIVTPRPARPVEPEIAPAEAATFPPENVPAPATTSELLLRVKRSLSPAVPMTPPVSIRRPAPSIRADAVRAPATVTLPAVSVKRSVSVEIPTLPPTSSFKSRPEITSEPEMVVTLPRARAEVRMVLPSCFNSNSPEPSSLMSMDPS